MAPSRGKFISVLIFKWTHASNSTIFFSVSVRFYDYAFDLQLIFFYATDTVLEIYSTCYIVIYF